MANPLKGEAALALSGRQFTMVFDFNAMCTLEEATGKTAESLLEDLDGDRLAMRDLRALVWASLQARQPELSLRDAGDLLSEDAPAVTGALIEAIGRAMPAVPENKKKAARRPPEKAARG